MRLEVKRRVGEERHGCAHTHTRWHTQPTPWQGPPFDPAATHLHSYTHTPSHTLPPLPQVLPPDMMELGEASAEGVVGALQRALARLHTVDPHEQHRRVGEGRHVARQCEDPFS